MKKKNISLFGVIGYPLGHSLSPVLHNFWIRQKKINAKYRKFEIKKNKLKKIIKEIKNRKIISKNLFVFSHLQYK